jgi:hypothetical protein
MGGITEYPQSDVEKEIADTQGLSTYRTRVKTRKRITKDIVKVTFKGGLELLIPKGWDTCMCVIVPPKGGKLA